MEISQTTEKYKATKLWNHVIRAFRSQMPIKNHRKHFKSFADTFTGTEAVDWLHGYLSAKASASNSSDSTKKENEQLLLSQDVTREQTLALLNKFYDRGLFERARSKPQEKTSGASNHVKDDGTLYKFANLSPSKFSSTPLALKNNSRSESHSNSNSERDRTPTKKSFLRQRPVLAVTPISYRKLPETDNKPISNSEGRNENKTAPNSADRCSMMEQLLSMDGRKNMADSDLDVEEISAPSTAFSSRHGSVRMNKAKPEQEVKPDLPQLELISRQLSCEEVEGVWKTLALSSLRQLLRLDDNAFDDAFFIKGQNICHNAKYVTARGVTKVFSKLDDLPNWALQAMKCLATWPWKNTELNWPCYPGFERDVFATVLDFFATQPEPMVPIELQELMLELLERVEYMDVQQWDVSHEDLMQAVSPAHLRCIARSRSTAAASADDDISVETEFGSRSPVTRVVEREPRSTTTNEKQDDVLNGLRSELEANVRSIEEILATLPGLVRSPRLMRQLKELREKEGDVRMKKEENENGHSQWTPPSRTTTNGNGHFDCKPPTGFLNLPGARFSLASTMTGSFSLSGSPPTVSVQEASPSFFTRSGRQMACKALQLCLLFIPPRNRRWLQLLLRMMAKICVNYCLRLDKRNAVSNRSILLDAYCDVIIPGRRDAAENANGRQQRLKLVSFLLDSMNHVFAQPMELISSVENRLRQMQRAKISYQSNGQNGNGLTVKTGHTEMAYCERISPQEYELQSSLTSRHALKKLMDSIADDKNLSGNEKRKRLKKFKDNYPDLFYQRFPNKVSFEALIKMSNGGSKK